MPTPVPVPVPCPVPTSPEGQVVYALERPFVVAVEQPPRRGEAAGISHGREARDPEAAERTPYRVGAAEHGAGDRGPGQRVGPGREEEDGETEGAVPEVRRTLKRPVTWLRSGRSTLHFQTLACLLRPSVQDGWLIFCSSASCLDFISQAIHAY